MPGSCQAAASGILARLGRDVGKELEHSETASSGDGRMIMA